MVWEYFAILRRLTHGIQDTTDEKELRQTICICILLAVTTVETFLNLFFQAIVNKPQFADHKTYILKCLEERRSLEFKVNNWTKRLFNKGIDTTQGIGKQFADLKDLRNALMHFTSNKTVTIDGKKLHNVSDMTFYESLTATHAYDALHTAVGLIEEVLRFSGLTGSELQGRMLHWTGLPNAAILHGSR